MNQFLVYNTKYFKNLENKFENIEKRNSKTVKLLRITKKANTQNYCVHKNIFQHVSYTKISQ